MSSQSSEPEYPLYVNKSDLDTLITAALSTATLEELMEHSSIFRRQVAITSKQANRIDELESLLASPATKAAVMDASSPRDASSPPPSSSQPLERPAQFPETVLWTTEDAETARKLSTGKKGKLTRWDFFRTAEGDLKSLKEDKVFLQAYKKVAKLVKSTAVASVGDHIEWLTPSTMSAGDPELFELCMSTLEKHPIVGPILLLCAGRYKTWHTLMQILMNA